MADSRIVTGGGAPGPGLLLIVLLPALGPAQLWLRSLRTLLDLDPPRQRRRPTSGPR